jgi:hypothetical protein
MGLCVLCVRVVGDADPAGVIISSVVEEESRLRLTLAVCVFIARRVGVCPRIGVCPRVCACVRDCLLSGCGCCCCRGELYACNTISGRTRWITGMASISSSRLVPVSVCVFAECVCAGCVCAMCVFAGIELLPFP